MSEHKKRVHLNQKLFTKKMAPAGTVAEPLHRAVPPGISAGISQRFNKPGNAIENIRSACRHYVDKCAGQYTNNVMAARYVHQLADEVLVLLEALKAAEEQKISESKASSVTSRMELLLKEWNENFPPSLGNVGSPKVIAAKLTAMTKEIQTLQDTIKSSNKSHDAIITDLQNQLKLSRSSILLERQSMGEDANRREQQFQAELKQAQNLVSISEKNGSDKLTRLERELNAKLKHAQINREKLQIVVDKLLKENQRLAEKSKVTQSSLVELDLQVGDKVKPSHIEILLELAMEDPIAGPLFEATELQGADGAPLIPAASSPSLTTTTTGGNIENNNTSTTVMPSMDATNTTRTIPRRRVSVSSILSEDVVSYKMYEEIMERLESTELQLRDKTAHAATVEQNYLTQLEILQFLSKRCASLEDMNANLREALGLKAEGQEITPYERQYVPRPMAHTPDFLQRADRSTFLDNVATVLTKPI